MWNALFGKDNKRQQAPFDEVSFGRFRVAIWKNRSRRGGEYFRFTLARLGRGRDGKWIMSRGFYPEDVLDIPGLAHALSLWFSQHRSVSAELRRELLVVAEVAADVTEQAEKKRNANGAPLKS